MVLLWYLNGKLMVIKWYLLPTKNEGLTEVRVKGMWKIRVQKKVFSEH